MEKVLFVIQSTTIKFQGYDLKNAPVSTGRGDVLARFIISSLFKPGINQTSNILNDTYSVWIFLNSQFIEELSSYFQNLGKITQKLEAFSVVISSNSPYFKSAMRNNKKFFTEFDILKAMYDSFENILVPNYRYSIFSKYCNNSLLKSLENMHSQGYKIIILDEEAPNSLKIKDPNYLFKTDEKLLFVIGDQLGYSDLKSKDSNNFPNFVSRLKLGNESQLSSSIITLIKFKLNENQIK